MADRKLSGFLAMEAGRAGALTDHVAAFVSVLGERGYARSSTREQVRLVAALGRWLIRQRLPLENLGEQHIERFLAHRRRAGRQARSNDAVLRRLLAVLGDAGAIRRDAGANVHLDRDSVAQIEHDFSRHLSQERGLSAATLINYVPVVRDFLRRRFGRGPVDFGRLHPQDVTDFVIHEARVAPRRTQVIVPALRGFLRWLYVRGETDTQLAGCVPAVARWRLSTLPKSIAADQVERLLRSCGRTTESGRRNYAILLLLARLGLRAGEVVAMELEDLDWEAGEITVRGKGGRRDRLPLPDDVGAALAAYLRYSRPRCFTRRLFVCSRAPRKGFTNSVAICSIVSRALARAGLAPARRGAHLLRHSLACTMLRHGASLCEIGEVLRHRSPDTTALYAKVDITALRELAPAWPLTGGGK
jgi:site-specific recombinase XerD